MVSSHSFPLSAFSIVLVLLWVALYHTVSAQVATTSSFPTFLDTFLGGLDSLGFTNFTALVRQVDADPAEAAFSLSLSDSSTPKTLFIPNNDAFVIPDTNAYDYSFRGDDTGFLSALLLYHLAPGQYLRENVGSGQNHTVAPTSLQGHGMNYLENDEPQVLVLGTGADGIEVYNQRQPTTVLEAYTFEHLTLHIVNNILGIPPGYPAAMQFAGLTQFEALRQSASVPSLDGLRGFTLFAPTDDAVTAAQSQTLSLTPRDIWNNHVIFGRTVWSSDFKAATYTAASNFSYDFSINDGALSTVTLNGVTANIIRSDYLTSSGVIHIVDQVFYNVAVAASTSPPTSTPASASDTSSSTLSSASTAPSATASSTASCSANASSPCLTGSQGTATSAAAASSGSAVKPGVIVAIIMVLFVALLTPLLMFIILKRREAKRRRFTISPPEGPYTMFELPTAALRVSPFHSSFYDSENGEWSYPPSRASHVDSNITLPPAARTLHEKPSFPSMSGEDGVLRDMPQSSRDMNNTNHVPLSQTFITRVVDLVTHQVAQRFDPVPPMPGILSPPPSYSSPPR